MIQRYINNPNASTP